MSTMEKTLEQTRITLSNAANNPQVLALLTQYGYGSERLQEGMALYEAARDTVQSQHNANLSKKSATKSFNQRLKETQLHYHHDLRSARLALKQYGESHAFLQLDGARTRLFDGWRTQVKDFYLGLYNHPEWQAQVQSMGLSAERIQQGLQHLQTLEALRAQQYEEQGGTVDTQQQRKDAFATLHNWMVTFRGVARFALAAYPAHLARLGLKPATRKQNRKDEPASEAKVTISNQSSFGTVNLLTAN